MMRITRNKILISFILSLLFCFPIGILASNRSYQAVSPKEGVYIHTDKDIYFAGDNILFKVYRFNLNDQPKGWESKAAYLSIYNQTGGFVAKRELVINNDTHHGYIVLPDTLASGIYKIVGWTNSMIMNESPLFAKQIVIVNRFDTNQMQFLASYRIEEIKENEIIGDSTTQDNSFTPTQVKSKETPVKTSPLKNVSCADIKIIADKEIFDTREKVTLSIDFSDIPDGIASASITVARSESFFDNSPNLLSYFNQNLLTDNLPVITQYTQNLDEEQFKKLSVKKEWPTQEASHTKMLPENYGLVLSGRVIDAKNKRPKENATILLSSVDTLVNLKHFETDDDGTFYFIIDEFYAGKALYLSVFNETPDFQDLEIIVDDKFFSSKFDPQSFAVHPKLDDYIEECKLIKRAQKAYNIKYIRETNGETEPKTGTPYLYRTPVVTIKLADYVPMDNFLDISNEIIPVLRIQKQKYSYITRIVSARTRSLLLREPQFFLDGIYIPNLGDIINLSSEDLDRIEVVNLPWALGSLEFSGIVALYSKKDNYKNLNQQSGHTIISGISSTNGYQMNFPLYESSKVKDNFPDFREVLYWMPNIEFTKSQTTSVEFYTSDVKGDYAAVVEGFTTSGIPFSKRIFITVK